MPAYCDVALPVPLDQLFTYNLKPDETPVVGGRVLVPFRSERMVGIVCKLHDQAPEVKTRAVISVLDGEPLLDEHLMKLGEWIAHYYLAPLGEVFRTMLPLQAEVKRQVVYRIADAGLEALHASATAGSSRRSKKSIAEQMLEYEVLDYLADGEAAREQAIRSATGASRKALESMLRKKWITREDVSSARDASRKVAIAVLNEDAAEGKWNANQQAILAALRAADGRTSVESLRGLEVPRTTLQTLVRRGAVAIEQEAAPFHLSQLKPRAPLGFIFHAEQKSALEHMLGTVAARKFSATLLHGVTGSGKTAVYLAAMQEVLRQGRSALLLVPEIGLTPAAAANLHSVFGEDVAILHSALTADERAEQWHRIHRGEARIVVGTRSAVFAPVRDLALVVVDEEHDTSYKQEETPRYHGRDVAVMRAKFAGAAVVLGSATPSLESFHNAKSGKYALVEMRTRVERRPLPEVEVVDMRDEFQKTGDSHLLARTLTEEIGERLGRGEQVMVLLNRRGYSSLVLCRTCGDTAQCKNCAIALTFHKASHRLECHYCGYRQGVPETCPKCGSEYVQFLGVGSEKLEERLHGLFPQARIARLDRDTVRGRHDFERALARLHAGEIDILVGTQMIAKGHDIHGVTLVGVVGADFALSFPDFRAAERTFQLLTQVAGRAGRGETPGKVVLQTYFPDHYAIQHAALHDYAGFAERELRYRGWMHYPPFSALANVLVRSDSLDNALRWSGALGRWFEQQARPAKDVRVLGPAAAPIVRLKRDYRYHFVLKAQSREKMNALLRGMVRFAAEEEIPRSNLVVDVDALSLL